MSKGEIFTTQIIKGTLTYIFSINKNRNGKLYLKLSENKKTDNGLENNELIVLEEDFKDFSELLQQTLTKFQGIKRQKQRENKTYSIKKIRETHKQAYQPWTQEDDNKLEKLFCEGKKINELAKIFGRNSGSISSRLKKFKLKEKRNF